jgi:hypothetical protein
MATRNTRATAANTHGTGESQMTELELARRAQMETNEKRLADCGLKALLDVEEDRLAAERREKQAKKAEKKRKAVDPTGVEPRNTRLRSAQQAGENAALVT